VEKICEQLEPIITKVFKEIIPQCPPEIAAEFLEKNIKHYNSANKEQLREFIMDHFPFSENFSENEKAIYIVNFLKKSISTVP